MRQRKTLSLQAYVKNVFLSMKRGGRGDFYKRDFQKQKKKNHKENQAASERIIKNDKKLTGWKGELCQLAQKNEREKLKKKTCFFSLANRRSGCYTNYGFGKKSEVSGESPEKFPI
ncbi:MAG: hypothetical protein LUF00_06715 [Lachnospiraceae bacterium]|nr:hypothetical protein [Lachnospiraceae bacterium]